MTGVTQLKAGQVLAAGAEADPPPPPELEPEPAADVPELEPEPAADVHVGPLIVLESNVTEPADSAKNRPFKVAPVFMAFAPFCDITVPLKEVVVSRVVELPTLHHTLHGSPPVTDEPGDVISVDTVLKIQTPDPVRLRFPDSESIRLSCYSARVIGMYMGSVIAVGNTRRKAGN